MRRPQQSAAQHGARHQSVASDDHDVTAILDLRDEGVEAGCRFVDRHPSLRSSVGRLVYAGAAGRALASGVTRARYGS